MGDLTIRILEARNLIPADHNGKSDPFATVEILEDPMQKKQKTHTIFKTLNPVWQETFSFRAPSPNCTILFKVWDRDLFKRNDPLGNVKVNVGQLPPRINNSLWLDLMGVPHGKLHVEIVFSPFPQAGGGAAQQPVQYPQQQPYPPMQQQQPPRPMPPPMQPVQPPPPQQQPPYYPQPTGSAKPQYPPSTPYSGNPPPPPKSYPSVRGNPGAYPPPPRGAPLPPPPAGIESSFSSLSIASNPPGSVPRASSYPPPPPPIASGYTDDDVGVDYTKMASDFSQRQRSQTYPTPAYSQQPAPPQPYAQAPPQPYPQQPVQSYPQQPQPYSQPYPQQPPYPQPPYSQQSREYPQQGYPPQQAYPPQYPPVQQGYPPQGAYVGGLVAGPKLSKFFVDVKKRQFRDYIVIMDMSGSMAGKKWEQAKAATMKIAPFACQADPDGITLYLFNGRFSKYQNLRDAEQVRNIFSREKPSGTTNLASVLQAAFSEHFSGSKPTTILVVTDGEPDSQAATVKEIVRASQKLRSQEDLSVSFIQIGIDNQATRFLKYLDNALKSQGAKFDIVDAISADELGHLTFDELIEKSIYD